jgi:hypothetical protein
MSEIDPRFPVGRFVWKGESSEEDRSRYIQIIEETPANFRAVVETLTPEQLDTPYRPAGWTARQVIHHVPDSHMNSFIRFKLALTEDCPTIKPYDESRWAELADVGATPIETSLVLLESLHQRWVALLRSMKPADFARTFRHPEIGNISLDKNLALYAWHGPHHLGHLQLIAHQM